MQTNIEYFSEEAIEDLRKSGLSEEIVKESQIKPAVETELKQYGILYWDKKRRQKRFEALYIIPYLITYTDKGKFCRVKVKHIPEYPEFEGKYTQPQKQFLRDTCHLYILPSELEKFKSPRCKLAIIEGEKKALKLIQEIRKIENELDYKIAVIGISGVNNWQTAPEWTLVNLTGREVITFFDADSEHNINVSQAELELAGFLYSKGAGSVKSAVWSISEGKGIDDFLVNAEDKQLEKLKGLLDSVISIFEKYKNKLQDKELLKAFFKYPVRVDNTRLEYLKELVRDETNIKKKTLDSIIKIMRIEFEEEQQEKLQEQIKKIFGNDNIQIPSNFLWEQGFLKDTKGNIITKFFIVKEKILNEKEEQTGLILKFITGKEIFINTEHLTKKALTLIFNKNNIGMDEKTAVKVLEYITQYQNVNFIPERKKSFAIGWIDEDYYLPQTIVNIEFDEDLTEQYKASGEKEKELELMRLVFKEGKHLALGYIFGFASTLIKPLDLQNFVIFNQGLTGKGKTTTNLLGLSIFGNHKKIKRNLNTTETGLEIYLSNRKDTLILLDEVNTGKKDVINQLVKIIYDFESGKGRTRATINLRTRQTAEYRGILSISSEDSLKHLLEQTEKETKGALRRSIIIDFGEFREIDNDIFLQIYTTINKHYGNLIKDWIEFLKVNMEDVELSYYRWVDELKNEDRGFKFNGQERHLALLFTTAELVNKVFNVDIEDIFNVLWDIAEYNHFEFAEVIEITKDRLKEKLEQFISENIQNFYRYEISENGVLLEKVIPKRLFGKIEQDETDENITYVFISGLGLREFAKYLKFPEKEVKKLLVDFGFAEGAEDRIIKQTMKRVSGASIKVYQITLS